MNDATDQPGSERPSYGSGMSDLYDERMYQPSLQLGTQLLAIARAEFNFGDRARILELGAGTGHMACQLARDGHEVTALDRSPSMVEKLLAKARKPDLLDRLRVVQADMCELNLDTTFDLIMASGNTINHVASRQLLDRLLNRARLHARNHTLIAFDFNTRLGLESWNSVSVMDSPNRTVISKGWYQHGDPLARMRMTGFSRNADHAWERFDEVITNLALPCSDLVDLLEHNHWSNVLLARPDGAHLDTESAEEQPTIMVVARARMAPQ